MAIPKEIKTIVVFGLAVAAGLVIYAYAKVMAPKYIK
jgi:hypothetical protein